MVKKKSGKKFLPFDYTSGMSPSTRASSVNFSNSPNVSSKLSNSDEIKGNRSCDSSSTEKYCKTTKNVLDLSGHDDLLTNSDNENITSTQSFRQPSRNNNTNNNESHNIDLQYESGYKNKRGTGCRQLEDKAITSRVQDLSVGSDVGFQKSNTEFENSDNNRKSYTDSNSTKYFTNRHIDKRSKPHHDVSNSQKRVNITNNDEQREDNYAGLGDINNTNQSVESTRFKKRNYNDHNQNNSQSNRGRNFKRNEMSSAISRQTYRASEENETKFSNRTNSRKCFDRDNRSVNKPYGASSNMQNQRNIPGINKTNSEHSLLVSNEDWDAECGESFAQVDAEDASGNDHSSHVDHATVIDRENSNSYEYLNDENVEESWKSSISVDELDTLKVSNEVSNSQSSQSIVATKSNQGIQLNVGAEAFVPNDTSRYTRRESSQKDTASDYHDNYFDSTSQQKNWTSNTSKHNILTQESDQDWRYQNSRRSLPVRSQNQNMPKRYSEGHSSGNNRESGSKGNAGTWQSRDPYDRRSEKIDMEFKQFCDEERKKLTIKFIRVKEIEQDLFTMPKEYSLGHCVAEDMRMGSGIAVNFKRDFKNLGVLLNQKQKQGGLAVLEDETDKGRYIYYLITKRESSGKPTYEKFWSSLQKMRNHIAENNVKKLAIPRLGCGLDRLEWVRVKHMIEFLFRDVEVEITVCNFQQLEDSPAKPQSQTCKVVHVQKSIADIEEETTIIYLSTRDGHVSNEMEQLGKKFTFISEFRQARKELGDVIRYDVPNKYILYGCIVRKTINDLFNFESFEKCLSQVNKNNRKDQYIYIGIQAIKDANDDLLMEKIITLLRNCLKKVDIYVTWYGELVHAMPLPHRDLW